MKLESGESAVVRIAYIDRYIKKYSEPNPVITQATFVDLHDSRKEAITKEHETNLVRSYKRGFRDFLKDFSSTEGRELPYSLALKNRGYHLKLIKNLSPDNQPSKIEGHIAYTEHRYFSIKYVPLLVRLFFIIFIPIIVVLFGSGVFFLSKNDGILRFFTGFCLIVLSVVFGMIEYSILRLPEIKFVYVILKQFFLKVDGDRLMLVSYSGTCPICGGHVGLTYSRVKWRGYAARCKNNPDEHVFSFDHTTLRGEKL